MVKIRRIGHDHQAPFWHVLLLLLLSANQAVTRGENKLPHAQYTSEPQDFAESEPPIKLLLGGLIRCGPNPSNPPYRGAKLFFWGVVTEGPF